MKNPDNNLGLIDEEPNKSDEISESDYDAFRMETEERASESVENDE